MPLDASGAWVRDKVVSQDEILDAISAVYPLVPAPARGAAPADRWLYADGQGDVGVIPSVTKPFCGDCDRVRLTAEGQLRTCLFETREFDLRGIVRGGGSDDDLAAEIVRAVGTKWAGHAIGQVTFIRPNRSMSSSVCELRNAAPTNAIAPTTSTCPADIGRLRSLRAGPAGWSVSRILGCRGGPSVGRVRVGVAMSRRYAMPRCPDESSPTDSDQNWK